MKRQLRFRDKLKLFRHWMKQQEDYGLITSCSVCQSTRIDRIKSKDIQPKGSKSIYYNAKYKCMDCGAVATCLERWSPR